MEVHGDKINFNASATVPAGTLSPGAVYRLAPRFTYENTEIVLVPMEFNGSRHLQNIAKSYSLEYLPGMEDGKLEIVGNFTDTKSGEKASYRLPLSSTKGVITTSRLLEEDYVPAYSQLEPYYFERDTLRLDYEFALGGYELLQNQVNNQLNGKLDSLVLSDKIILGSRVIGTHSPVGSDAVNRVLSEKRALEVKKIFDDKIANHPSTELDRLGLELEVEFNSWAIFIEKFQATALWERDKDIISEIITDSSDYETVKSQLLKLSDIAEISREVFPKLQMSRLEIAYGRTIKDPQKFSEIVDEILNNQAEESISFRDILAITQQESNARRRIQLYESATGRGTSWELYNDWAATYLDSYNQWNQTRGKRHLANVYDLLKRSIKIKRSREANINLGIANSIAGRFDLALAYFERANSISNSSNSSINNAYHQSRAVAEVKSGNYEGAISSFNQSTGDKRVLAYNLGLANLLAGKYNSALEFFNTAMDRGADSSRTLYTQAIAANRSGNRNLTVNPHYS